MALFSGFVMSTLLTFLLTYPVQSRRLEEDFTVRMHRASSLTSSSIVLTRKLLTETTFQSSGMNFPTSEPCPSHPLDLCDFFVDGFRESVPMLLLPTEATGEAVISSFLRDSHRPSEDPMGIVSVQTSLDAQFMCPAPEGTDSTGQNPALGPSFTVISSNNQSRIQLRNLDSTTRSDLKRRCVVLPLGVMRVTPEAACGTTTLVPGDGNWRYPESRRCVVFQTGPSPPRCPGLGLASSLSPCAAVAPLLPPPVMAPQPTSGCGESCPSDPHQLCDFFFEGYTSSIPVFNLSSAVADQPISPRIQIIYQGNPVVVEVDGTNLPARSFGCLGSKSLGNQFYVTGQEARLVTRTFQGGLGEWKDSCVLLPLTEVQVLLPSTASPINLNPGDENSQFPELRRCVVFQADE